MRRGHHDNLINFINPCHPDPLDSLCSLGAGSSGGIYNDSYKLRMTVKNINTMKRFFILLMASIFLISPLPVWAWQRYIHDDGWYRDLAIAASGQMVVTGIVQSSVIELSFLNNNGSRLTHATIEPPDQAYSQPRQRLWLDLQRVSTRQYHLNVYYVAGEEYITYATVYAGLLTRSANQWRFTLNQTNQTINIPDEAKDLAIFKQGGVNYLVWRIATEDNISTIMVGTVN